MLAVQAQQKGIELTCQTVPGTPYLLRGDPGRLRQILVNLVGNAVKFTPQGDVSITCANSNPRTALRLLCVSR